MKFEKAMDAIAASLLPGEIMTYGAAASMDDRNQTAFGRGHERTAFVTGALAVTSTRIRFLGALLLDRQDITVPLEGITSLEPIQRRLAPRVQITAAGVMYEFQTSYAEQFVAAAWTAAQQRMQNRI